MANSTTAEHAVIRRDISKFKWTMMQVKQHKVAYLMIAPFFILFFIFTVVPVLLSIILSFTTFNMLEWPTLVYADNYIRLFLDDEIFLIAVKNTLMFAIITGPASYLLSLFFAWFTNELRPKIRAVVTLAVLCAFHFRQRLSDLDDHLFQRPVWLCQRAADEVQHHSKADSLVPGREIHLYACRSRCALDQLGHFVPDLYRRLPGRR